MYITNRYFRDMDNNLSSNSFSMEQDTKKNFQEKSLTYPKLDPIWEKRAEDELNETKERYKQEMCLLKNLVISNSKTAINFIYSNFSFLGDKNLIVPCDEEFLVRFLRARKFDANKAFNMVV